MLETLLDTMHNWFEIPGAAVSGKFEVVSGMLDVDFVAVGQYYRVMGSVFNDGLHQHPAADMQDETFDGVIIPLAVPRAVVDLAEKIKDWREKNPETDKVSESFGGYSYSRGGRSGDSSSSGGWRAAFAPDIRRWKKVN